MSENKVTVFGKNAEERLEILRDEKGNILLTDDQKRAVLERGRILVSASAGSANKKPVGTRIPTGYTFKQMPNKLRLCALEE